MLSGVYGSGYQKSKHEKVGDIITGRQERALAALIAAPTIEAAATAAAVGYTTLRRWLKDDLEFRRAYEGRLTELVADAAKQAKLALAPALATLQEIAADKEGPAAVRVQAARSLLDAALKLTEISDIVTRLEALEELEGERAARRY